MQALKSLNSTSPDSVVKKRTTLDARTEGMFKLDLEPLAPRLLQNREVHIEYLKYAQEQADIHRGIVEQAKAKQPLDKELDFASLWEIKGMIGFSANTKIGNMKNKVEAQPRKVNKKNRVVEPTRNVNVKHSLLNANSEPICASCKKSMFDGVHDICLLDFVENVNSRAKSAIQSRITSANIVPPKKTTSYFVEIQKPELKVYSRKPKNVKNVGSSKKAKIVENKNANHSEPNHTWGSNATDIPSSSPLVMTVRLGNDHIARIMRYGDYQLGNVTISRTISLDDMLKTSPICLLSKASKTKSWLWHDRLSHLNFGTLNKLAKDGLARGIPRLKFQKDHLCSACALGKSKKSSHQPKAKDTNQIMEPNLSIRHFVNFMKMLASHIKHLLPALLSRMALLKGETRNLVERCRTMLILSKAPLFLWAEAINTACYTQNHSIIRHRYNKTPYELMQEKKPDVSFFYVFCALCYPTNDNDDLSKLDAKADIGIFIGYAPAKKAFRIYNKRTRKIIETIHVTFDDLTAMASEQFSSGPGLQCLTPATSSLGLVPNPVSQQPCISPPRDDWDRLFQPMFDEYFTPPSIVVSPVQEAATLRDVVLAYSFMSTSIDQDAPSSSTPSTQEQEQSLNISQVFKELPKTLIFRDDPLNESPHEESTSQGSSSNVRQTHTPFEYLGKWTKNHLIANVIDDPSCSVFTRKQLQTDAMWCYFDAFLTSIEPKNFKQAMTEPSWIDAMQEEIHEFQRLEVSELVPCLDKVLLIKLKWIYKVKTDEFGWVLKNKARLVAQGLRQE
ncbi:integrase, catalytic region, zinc finger, CCHC-type containing protein [Tanacetum coccineum]